MKKIIITAVIAFCGAAFVSAQDASGVPAGTKIMTVAEANALNGVAQPTINGMPYSQYKAQQDALKTQKTTTLQTTPVPVGINGKGVVQQNNKASKVQNNNEVIPNANSKSRAEEATKPVVEIKQQVQPDKTENTSPTQRLGVFGSNAQTVNQNTKIETAPKLEGTSADPKFVPQQEVSAKSPATDNGVKVMTGTTEKPATIQPVKQPESKSIIKKQPGQNN